jgi:hypothetical protein
MSNWRGEAVGNLIDADNYALALATHDCSGDERCTQKGLTNVKVLEHKSPQQFTEQKANAEISDSHLLRGWNLFGLHALSALESNE